MVLLVFQGELVWFDPGVGCVQPGEVVEFHRSAQVVVVESDAAGKVSLTQLHYQTIIIVLGRVARPLLFHFVFISLHFFFVVVAHTSPYRCVYSRETK